MQRHNKNVRDKLNEQQAPPAPPSQAFQQGAKAEETPNQPLSFQAAKFKHFSEIAKNPYLAVRGGGNHLTIKLDFTMIAKWKDIIQYPESAQELLRVLKAYSRHSTIVVLDIHYPGPEHFSYSGRILTFLQEIVTRVTETLGNFKLKDLEVTVHQVKADFDQFAIVTPLYGLSFEKWTLNRHVRGQAIKQIEIGSDLEKELGEKYGKEKKIADAKEVRGRTN